MHTQASINALVGPHHPSRWLGAEIIVFALAVSVMMFTTNGLYRPVKEVRGQFAQTTPSTEDPGKTLPPCPANTWPRIFDGNRTLAVGSPESDDRAYGIATTRDGRAIFLAGNSSPRFSEGIHRKAFWVSRHDHCGNLVWHSNLDSVDAAKMAGEFRQINDMVIDEGRKIISVTGTYLHWDGNPSHDERENIFAAQLNMDDGRVLWSATVDGQHAQDEGRGIVLDGFGNVYVTGIITFNASALCGGYASGTPPRPDGSSDPCASPRNDRDAFVAKFKPPSQTPVWLRTYSSPFVPLGESTRDWGNGIIMDGEFLYVTGSVTRRAEAATVKSALWLAKIDPANGNLLFNQYYERARRVDPDGDPDWWRLAAQGRRLTRNRTGFSVIGDEQGHYVHPWGAWEDILLTDFTLGGALRSHAFFDGSREKFDDTDIGFDVATYALSGFTIFSGGLHMRGLPAEECVGQVHIIPECSALYARSSAGWRSFLPPNAADPGTHPTAQSTGLDLDQYDNAILGGHLRRNPFSRGTQLDFVIHKISQDGLVR